MDAKQRLGIKVFYYYLSQKILVGFLLLLVSFFIYSSKDGLISKMMILFPLSIASSIFSYFIGVLYIVALLLIIIGSLISWLDYISCDFTLDENAFIIRRGILNKKEISIPYRQIQDIDIEQTFNNKMMGVSKLVILTAGNDNNDKEGESEGIFQVIDSNIAEKMRADILERANIQEVKEVRTV